MGHVISRCLNKGYYTKRLALRTLKMSDLNDMFEYTSDPIVCKYLNWGPHQDISETKEFIEKTLEKYVVPDDIVWGIEYNKKLIGVVRIYNIDLEKKESEVSYVLNRKYQGKGFMTETIQGVINFCFCDLGMKKVKAFYDEENIGSFNVMNKCNMKKVSKKSTEIVIKGQRRKMFKCEIEKGS